MENKTKKLTTLWQKLIKMKLFSGKMQFWEWKSPRWCRKNVFLAHAGIVHSSTQDMSEQGLIFYILWSCKVTKVQGHRIGSVPCSKGREFDPCSHSFFFHRLNLWKISTMSSDMKECKISAWARDKMFPLPRPFVPAPSHQGGRILRKFLIQCACSDSVPKISHLQSLQQHRKTW